MLSLMQTTTNFAPHGMSSPNPYLVDQTNMNIVSVPTLWTVYIATIPGRTRRPNTWLAYARNLLLWLNVCVENGSDWATVSEEDIAAWRNHLLGSRSDRTKRRYARSTVSSYIRTVCDFYEWAHKRGHVASNPVRFIPISVLSKRRRIARSSRAKAGAPDKESIGSASRLFATQISPQLYQSMGLDDGLFSYEARKCVEISMSSAIESERFQIERALKTSLG